MNPLWYLFFGFGSIWVVLGVYMFSLAGRQRRLVDDVQMLDDVTKRAQR